MQQQSRPPIARSGMLAAAGAESLIEVCAHSFNDLYVGYLLLLLAATCCVRTNGPVRLGALYPQLTGPRDF